jgi:hypothetical protein
MHVIDENSKLANEVADWQASQQVKGIQKLYEERYSEILQIIDQQRALQQ